MAYGSPDTVDDVEAYYTHIRGGRAPSPESVARLRARYERVGGRTPLLSMTSSLGDALATVLQRQDPDPPRVYVGMKHWRPFIADTMRAMRDDGIRDLTTLALAPHFSRMSIGGYRRAVEEGNAALGSPFQLTMIETWHRTPSFIDFIAGAVRQALAPLTPRERMDVLALFTAHSLPVRIREWGDPYEREVHESSAAVAARAGLPGGRWRVAWQSAGQTGEPWIGPDVLEVLDTIHTAGGARTVLVVPIGFVADHLEVLYDLDVEAQERAARLGIRLLRTSMPNDSPAFAEVLSDVLRAGRRNAARQHRPATA
jgi:ferrochelatase